MSYNIYLNESFHVKVDEQGYCLGDYPEGVLGVIVQVHHSNGSIYALKLPRLVAESDLENTLICATLEQECKSAALLSGNQNRRIEWLWNFV